MNFNAKDAKQLTRESLISHCLNLIHSMARQYLSKAEVPLSSQIDKNVLEDVVNNLKDRGFVVEENGGYLWIRW